MMKQRRSLIKPSFNSAKDATTILKATIHKQTSTFNNKLIMPKEDTLLIYPSCNSNTNNLIQSVRHSAQQGYF